MRLSPISDVGGHQYSGCAVSLETFELYLRGTFFQRLPQEQPDVMLLAVHVDGEASKLGCPQVGEASDM